MMHISIFVTWHYPTHPHPRSFRSPAFCLFPDFRQDRQFFMLISFFPVPLWITFENRTRLKKLFIWTTKSGGTQHHKQTKTTSDYSSATGITLVIFWTERNYCIISDCRYSFNNKRKNLWTSKKYRQSSKCTVFIWRIRYGKTSYRCTKNEVFH